jgi:Ca2+-transporting ATPase
VLALQGSALSAGLALDEVARRRERHGPNALVEGHRRGPARMLLDQFADFMVLVLIAAAVVASFLGEPQDTIAIVVIVVLNAGLGFVQEFRAERAMAALQALAASPARVRRGGGVEIVPAVGLVPGDVVLLEAGNAVPADLRLVDSAQLRVEEAALTGESLPVEKSSALLADPDLVLGDRRNMAYKSTVVTYGRATGVVVATGMDTELGRIAALLGAETTLQTPLQRRLARFGQRLALGVLALCAIIFAAGLLRGEAPLIMLLTALSLAVAAIPEALPAVVTVSLALGAARMVSRHALIRRLPAVETLGAVTYICTDKTGTLTQNRMEVAAYHVDGRRQPEVPSECGTAGPWAPLLTVIALNNDAVRGGDGTPAGDPTEIALLLAAERAGCEPDALATRLPRVAEIPFSSERGRMTTLHRDDAGILVCTKGAPERVVTCCVDQLGDAGVGPLCPEAVLQAADAMAREGLRVLAVAMRRLAEVPADVVPDAVEVGLTFLGLVGLRDPPRPEAQEAVARCQSAGIRVVMITGDHPATAQAIARMLGILPDGEDVLTGRELARLPPAEVGARVRAVRVYARVAPEQKIAIVQALQAHGEVVAMTGDGVNDAPALRRADIGVAMGRAGTDVAREAAHMVLLDDNFATIVAAVEEGRRIYDNVRKFIKYALACNAGEIWALFLAPLVGLPLPLLPIHILWINLVTDGLPGLALAVEPAERGVMRLPPRRPDESIFAQGLGPHVLWVGLLMGTVTLLTQAFAYRSGSTHWQSMTFTVLTLSQMGHVLAIRSERDSLLQRGLASNRALLGAVVLTCALQLATLYVPALHPIFKTEPLSAVELVSCLALSAIVPLAVEIEKALVRHGLLYRERASVAR